MGDLQHGCKNENVKGNVCNAKMRTREVGPRVRTTFAMRNRNSVSALRQAQFSVFRNYDLMPLPAGEVEHA